MKEIKLEVLEFDNEQLSTAEEGFFRVKVDGGYLYHIFNSMCFVPEIDLTRYESHLRDAFNAGVREGYEQAKKPYPINKECDRKL